MILDIEKNWGQCPGWFISLERETQIDLIAHYRLSKRDPKFIKKKYDKLKKDKFLKNREKYIRKGSQ